MDNKELQELIMERCIIEAKITMLKNDIEEHITIYPKLTYIESEN